MPGAGAERGTVVTLSGALPISKFECSAVPRRLPLASPVR
jgi:hypothetical protein